MMIVRGGPVFTNDDNSAPVHLILNQHLVLNQHHSRFAHLFSLHIMRRQLLQDLIGSPVIYSALKYVEYLSI